MAGSTFEYSLDGVNWTAANPSFTNAGTYSVWVRANAANYETTRAVRATVTINPRPAVIVANSATKTAGAADPIFTGYGDRLVRAGDLGAVSFGRSNAAEGVGFYPGVIGATYLANPNYSVTVVPGNFNRPGRYGSGDPGCCDARDAGPGCACCPGGSRSRRSGSGRHSCGCDAGSGRRAHRGRCHAAGRRAR